MREIPRITLCVVGVLGIGVFSVVQLRGMRQLGDVQAHLRGLTLRDSRRLVRQIARGEDVADGDGERARALAHQSAALSSLAGVILCSSLTTAGLALSASESLGSWLTTFLAVVAAFNLAVAAGLFRRSWTGRRYLRRHGFQALPPATPAAW